MPLSASVIELNCHPVKSMGGVSLLEALCTATGFEHDRRFMVGDKKGRFFSQREIPGLSLIEPRLASGYLVLRKRWAPRGYEELYISTDILGDKTSLQVWKDTGMVGKDYGPIVGDLLRQHLKVDCRLFELTSERQVDGRYAGEGDRAALQDGYPISLCSQSSFDDVIQGVNKPYSINRFRCNIVVGGNWTPFLEDRIKRIKIGEVVFKVARLTPRCSMIMVNQKTGEVDGRSLWDYLYATRRDTKNGKVNFGVYLLYDDISQIYQNTISIRVGDEITILE